MKLSIESWKKSLIILIASILAFSGFALSATPVKIAVFDFKPSGKAASVSGLGQIIPDLLEVCLATVPEIKVLERRQITKLLQEQKMSLAGITKDQAIKVGKLLNADFLIFGTVSPSGKDIDISLRMVSAKTSEILAQTQIIGNKDKLDNLLAKLTTKTVEELKQKSGLKTAWTAAKINLPTGEALAKLLQAQASGSQAQFAKALAELRGCISFDPDYALTRSRFQETTMPDKIYISVRDINTGKVSDILSKINSIIRSFDRTFSRKNSKMPLYIWNDLTGKDYFAVPIRNFVINNDQDLSRFNRKNKDAKSMSYPTYFFDCQKQQLLKGAILKTRNLPKGEKKVFVRIWDLLTGKTLSTWEITDNDCIAYFRNRISYGTNNYPFKILRNSNQDLAAAFTLTGNKKGIIYKYNDLFTGKPIRNFRLSKDVSDESYRQYVKWRCTRGKIDAKIYDADRITNMKIQNILDDKKTFQIAYYLFSIPMLVKRFSDDPLIFNYPNGSIYSPADGTQIKSFHLFSPISGKFYISRNDFTKEISSYNIKGVYQIYNDKREYFIFNRGAKGIMIFQKDLIAPPTVYPLISFVASDINRDNKLDFLTKNGIFSLNESIKLLPAENKLIDICVYSTSAFGKMLQDEFKYNKYDIFKKYRKTWSWFEWGCHYRAYSTPIIQSVLAQEKNLYIQDSAGLKKLLIDDKLIPEKDIDSYTKKQSYHFIKAKWQLTVMLDHTFNGDYIVTSELIDKSKPIHKPVTSAIRRGKDIITPLLESLKETTAVLENKSPDSSSFSTKSKNVRYPLAIASIQTYHDPQIDIPRKRRIHTVEFYLKN